MLDFNAGPQLSLAALLFALDTAVLNKGKVEEGAIYGLAFAALMAFMVSVFASQKLAGKGSSEPATGAEFGFYWFASNILGLVSFTLASLLKYVDNKLQFQIVRWLFL